jgi:hypothetical protein
MIRGGQMRVGLFLRVILHMNIMSAETAGRALLRSALRERR